MSEKESLIRWEKEFERNYPVEKFQEISHFWWRDCYEDIERIIIKNIPLSVKTVILEYGCGSGISSLSLASKVKKVFLLDRAKNPLKCAKQLSEYLGVENAEFLNGDIFSFPFKRSQFDFCWNIGLIEHYDFSTAKILIEKVAGITKQSGYICLGVPNFRSLAILKARMLSIRALRVFTSHIKGYRLDDEKKYNEKKLISLLEKVGREKGFEFSDISIDYAGSVLPVETPRFIFRAINGPISRMFKRFSFLILLTAKVSHK